MITVCKIFEIAYSHHLPDYDGKCRNLHGHTGTIEVEVESVNSPTYPGMTADFYDIKNKIGPVIECLDHQYLNDVLNRTPGFLEYIQRVTPQSSSPLTYVPPTSENIVRWLRREIEKAWPEAVICRIRFWESPTSFAEWRK